MDPTTVALWLTAGSGLANTIGNFMGGGQSEGLSRGDQRFIADFNWKQALRQEDYQRNHLQYLVDDANKAGISPLAGLGVSPAAGPSAVAFGPPAVKEGRHIGDDIGRMGQNLARAVGSVQTADERAISAATARKAKAEADFVELQVLDAKKRLAQPANPPAPDPFNSAVTADVHGLPATHQLLSGPGGPERAYTDEYSRSLMARPISAMAADLANAIFETGREWPTVLRNVGRNPVDRLQKGLRRALDWSDRR